MFNNIIVALKGFIIGSTMLVPGVSGGTMAMILGIYEDLIKSISHFLKAKFSSLIFLGLFCAGALTGMFLFSNSILSVMEKFPMISTYFFLGAVLGGIPCILKESGVQKVTIPAAVHVAIGAVMVMGIELLPSDALSDLNLKSPLGIIVLLVAGFAVSIALILPGISVSFVLLVLGIYEDLLVAIHNLDYLFLGILGAGLILGIVTTTKALETAMVKHRKPTFLIILGFVIGSVVPIYPGPPTGFNILLCPTSAVLGFAIVQLISKLDK